jgi:Nitrous oxide-stimulated promoter
MPTDPPRIAREKKTMAAMVRLYCRRKHGTDGTLCEECVELLDYATCRLDQCPYGPQKPTCAKCPIHCYKPQMRERVKEVMRFSGPRMLLRHPILAIGHLLDGRRSSGDRTNEK